MRNLMLTESVEYFYLQLVEEFLSGQNVIMAPQTFHMGGLLQEMRDIEEAELAYAPQRGLYCYSCVMLLFCHTESFMSFCIYPNFKKNILLRSA